MKDGKMRETEKMTEQKSEKNKIEKH